MEIKSHRIEYISTIIITLLYVVISYLNKENNPDINNLFMNSWKVILLSIPLMIFFIIIIPLIILIIKALSKKDLSKGYNESTFFSRMKLLIISMMTDSLFLMWVIALMILFSSIVTYDEVKLSRYFPFIYLSIMLVSKSGLYLYQKLNIQKKLLIRSIVIIVLFYIISLISQNISLDKHIHLILTIFLISSLFLIMIIITTSILYFIKKWKDKNIQK